MVWSVTPSSYASYVVTNAFKIVGAIIAALANNSDKIFKHLIYLVFLQLF